MRTPIIALLTDFGLVDEYVGVMKGVILKINPKAVIVDICHDIPPQDIEKGAYLLGAAYKFFPQGTIFVAVVDPGVGSRRRIICVGAGGYYFLAPSNGILSYILENQKLQFAYEVTNRKFWLDEISDTFHGRDIFAPVAAHLSKGVHPSKLGARITNLKSIPLLKPAVTQNGIEGQILFTDRFGNYVTNIDRDTLNKIKFKNLKIIFGRFRLNRISKLYSEVRAGSPLAIFGSRGLLEVSVNKGNAKEILKLKPRAKVLIKPNRVVFKRRDRSS